QSVPHARYVSITSYAPTDIYTLSLHDALPICDARVQDVVQRKDAIGLLSAEFRRPGDVHGGKGDARDAFAGDLVQRKGGQPQWRSEEHTSELQSRFDLVCRLLLEKKNKKWRVM